MARISDEDVQKVRDATDLVSVIGERVVLKQKGRLFWGLCPFHGEKTSSFKVDPATQLWHCFGCGKGGDVFGFLMESDHMDFPDVVRLLADRAHIEISEQASGAPRGHRERLMQASEAAAEFYARVLTGSREGGATKARQYLGSRGFGSDISKRWRLGFSPGRRSLYAHLAEKGFTPDEMVSANLVLKSDRRDYRDRFYERVMFPIADVQGRIIAFGGRVLGDGQPKYLNTSDTPVFKKSANMYGIDRAKATMSSTGVAVVVEGYTDVIALHEAGMTNAVATLGTALTRQHLKLLGRFARTIVYLFDGDAAGMRAADAAADFIDEDSTPEAGGARVELRVAIIPEGKDPADYVAAAGVDAMRAVLEQAAPLLQFAIDRRLSRWDLDRPEERARALKEAAEVLAPIKDSLMADDYANYIADKLLADFATVRRAIAQAKPQPVTRGAEEEPEQVAPVSLTPVDNVRLVVERELLGILAIAPELRTRAQELLTSELLFSDESKTMAQVIAKAPRGASASEVFGSLESALPGSAQVFSAMKVSDSHEEREMVANGLQRRLKGLELERRIAVGKAQLKSQATIADSIEYDRIFREVSSLQRGLDALRRGADMTDDQPKVQE